LKPVSGILADIATKLPGKAAVLCGFFACLLPFANAQNGRWYPEDEPAPALKLKTTTDEEIDIAKFKGRMVIVNFWATWCGPCIAEMPSLQALVSKIGKKNVALVGVNFHESPQKIRDFQLKYNVQFPLLRDAWQEASTTWKVAVLPTTFIIDANGTLRYRVVGEVDWSSKQVADRLKAVMARGNRAPGAASTVQGAAPAGLAATR
jgi:cytochrome c biogenesis protein CcmG, thiol:disulfide interchange protein DsbE